MGRDSLAGMISQIWKDGQVPKIARQSASRPLDNGVVSTGSLLDDAIDVRELQDDYMSLLMYGKSGVGKTTLACQFPKPLLLLAMEPNKTGGAMSVKLVEGITYKRITDYDVFVNLASEMEATGLTSSKWQGKLATVVIDTCTSLEDVALMKVMGWSKPSEQLMFGVVSGEQYQQRSSKAKEALRPWINLPCHKVLLAKEKDHNPPKDEKGSVRRDKLTRGFQQESFLAASMGQATVDWLHDACDYVCRLYVDKEVKLVSRKLGKEIIEEEQETGKYIRCLRCGYHVNYASRFRSYRPEEVPDVIENPTWAKIKKAVYG